MRDLLERWRLAPAVRALMALKGFRTVAAMILVSELGEVHRFNHPRQVMAYLGLVPTEHLRVSRRQGISPSAVPHLRWLLVECAQHYAAAESEQGTEPTPAGQSQQVRASVGKRRTACMGVTPDPGPALQRNKAIVAVARGSGIYLGTVAHPTLLRSLARPL